MQKRNLQCSGVLVLVITAIAASGFNGCRKLPVDDYSTIMACCKNSPIIYFEEIMAKCRFFNSSVEKTHNDLILMNVCETYCYLDTYEVIHKNGSIREDKLIDFLRMHLPAELHAPLRGFVTNCLSDVEVLNDFRIYPPNCHWYYTALVNCLQEEILVNCPESEMVSTEVCQESRAFLNHCGLAGLRDRFDHNGNRLNGTDFSAESQSYYSSGESHSFSSEYGASYESESSEYGMENGTEAASTVIGETTKPIGIRMG